MNGVKEFPQLLERDGFPHLPCCPHRINYEAGEPIFFQGDFTNALYYIHRGKVKLSCLDESGKRLTLAILGEGEIFGALLLGGESPHEFSAVAWEDACICHMGAEHLQQRLTREPRWAWSLLRWQQRQAQRLLHKLLRLPFQDVTQRIAWELLQMAACHGKRSLQGIVIRLTHQELAELAGTTRETTTLTLHRFKRAGLLHTGDGHTRRQIVITDLKGLQEVAEWAEDALGPCGGDRIKVGIHGDAGKPPSLSCPLAT